MIRSAAGRTNPTLLNRLGNWRDHEAWNDPQLARTLTLPWGSPVSPCPSPETIGQFANAELSSSGYAAMEAHVETSWGSPGGQEHSDCRWRLRL